MEPEIPELEAWLSARDTAIDQLRKVVEKLNKYHKGANISNIIGRLTGIIGTLVGIGALVMTPATGGLSLAPGLIGIGAGVTGTGAAVTGKIVKKVGTKKQMSEVEIIFEKDHKCSKTIKSMIETIEKLESDILEFLEEQVKSKLEEEDVGDIDMEHHNSGGIPQQAVVSNLNSDHQGGQAADNVSNKDLKLYPVIKKGLRMAKKVNLFKARQFLQFSKKLVAPVKDILPKVSTGATPVTLGTGAHLLQLKKVVRFGGVAISVALLPFEVYELVKTSLELQKGDGHEAAKLVEDQITRLEDEMKNMKTSLHGKVQELNNFVLLIWSILSEGCDRVLGSLIHQILKRILPVKHLLKAFEKIDIQSCPPTNKDSGPSKLSTVLVNCEETSQTLYSRLSMFIWCAWILGKNTAIFLHNSDLTDDPVLWTLFGVSVNSFNKEMGKAVSILLPVDFPGDIVSQAEFHSNDTEWNGRCLVVNIRHLHQDYSLVCLLAPMEKVSRDLFMREMAHFIENKAQGKIFLAANFCCELKTMTTVVRNRVSKKVPYSMVKGLIPYKAVSEYLVNKPKERDGPTLLTYNILAKYSLVNPNDIDIRWQKCRETVVSTDYYQEQIKPILDMGVTDLWSCMGGLEFSREEEVSERVVTCTQNLNFFISPELQNDIEHCYLDHTLRFLGFGTQSALVVRGNSHVE